MPQITISNETLLGLGLLALAVAGGYYAQQHAQQPGGGAGGGSSASTGKSKKGKKKGKGRKDEGEAGDGTTTDEGGMKGSKEQQLPQQQRAGSGSQGKKAKQQQQQQKQQGKQVPPSFAQVADPQADVHAPSQPVDGSATTATPAGGAAKPKTLAEKKATKPRKTAVDDMIPPEDRPVGPSRVMKIVSDDAAGSSPTATSAPSTSPPQSQSGPMSNSAEDTTDDGWDTVEREPQEDAWERPKKGYAAAARDDGWTNVPVKAKAPNSLNRFSALSGASSPTASASGSSTPTKVQRKNANAAARKAAQKAEDERARLDRLAAHRREQEREKIAQLARKKTHVPGQKVLSGGMTASVNEKGSLIWE